MMFGEARLTERPPGGWRPAEVVKHHGFGTGPGTRLLLSRSLPAIVTQYCVLAAKAVVWVKVRIVFVGEFQVGFNVTPPGARSHVTVPMLIVSLNVTTIGAPCETWVAPLAGSVFVICGGTQCALNVHGLGFDPWTVMSGFPFVSFA